MTLENKTVAANQSERKLDPPRLSVYLHRLMTAIPGLKRGGSSKGDRLEFGRLLGGLISLQPSGFQSFSFLI